ncbi:AI-2E family transporter [Halomicrobium salinisoli]|uniref:AI-2E family transporter n=1 Tax=Halomicrobium salinisoli TaxID=2878391 RepID=UPI001CF0B934|nr:AI-2E family transporter [Halomicrobium salinisoli]
MPGPESPFERARLGWWLYIAVLAIVAGYLAYSFVGILALGVFGYYATRPIYREVEGVIDSDGHVAAATILLVLGPILLLLAYAGFRVFGEVMQFLGESGQQQLLGGALEALTDQQRQSVLSIVENPQQLADQPRQTFEMVLQTGGQVFSAVAGGLLLVSLAVTLTYFLLENGDDLAEGFRELVGGRETTAYSYATTVDEDLESVFFGNFLFVVAMSIVAAAAYWGTNLLAPDPLAVPMVPVLAVLTGVASLIPIVVGKVIYLPVVGYLAVQAVQGDQAHLAFVGGVLVAYFLVLDILPQTFIQPLVTGRTVNPVLLLFAYLLGPILFGWYGFFLLPILFVLLLEAVRIALPELLHGEPLTRRLSMGEDVGTDPGAVQESVPEEESADDAAGDQ